MKFVLDFLRATLMVSLILLCGAMVVGIISDVVMAQETTDAVAQLPTTNLPEWAIPFIPYIVLANAIVSIFSRISDRTKTDVDNKAIGWWSKIVNFLGGHWGMLNGDPSKPSANLLKS